MSGIRPYGLSNEELLRYCYVMGAANLPTEWVEVLLKRFESTLDRIEKLGISD